jgi:phospholipid/cholesterol/gamma-HCH transport system substrate-binding protein
METEKQIKPLLVKFNTVADSIQAIRIGETLQQANAAVGSLQRIVSKLEKGQGSAGKLLVSDSLYNGLNKSLVDLDKLLIDFRVQPKRYIHFSVFGKKNTAPTPEN